MAPWRGRQCAHAGAFGRAPWRGRQCAHAGARGCAWGAPGRGLLVARRKGDFYQCAGLACAAGALALSQVAVAACACGAGVGGAVCRERGIGRAGPASWMAQGGLFSVRGLVAWRHGAVAVTACARAAGVGVAVYRERRIGVRIFVLFFFTFWLRRVSLCAAFLLCR